MPLQAVVFHQDPSSYVFKKDLYGLNSFANQEVAYCEALSQIGGSLNIGTFNANSDSSQLSPMMQSMFTTTTANSCSSPEYYYTHDHQGSIVTGEFQSRVEVPAARRKRRRVRNIKNKEQVENQRMTHIAIERNRRKQMNDYLSVLRSLMPPSYVQRGDQASIISGAINYVKELEHHLQSLEAHKQTKQQQSDHAAGLSSDLFSDFFSFPQYSTYSRLQNSWKDTIAAERPRSAIVDVEVTMVENHASIRIKSKRNPKQLLKMVTGLISLGLNALHLNVTTVGHMTLYSFSVEVEEDCQLTSVNEIATAVYHMVGMIQEEEAFS